MERKNPFLVLDERPLPPSGNRPLEVCLVRGTSIESRHRVHAAVYERESGLLHQWGDPGLHFFPRSAVKLIQAVTWVAPGFHERWSLGPAELAIACGSHEGESYHVGVVEGWLKKLGLGEADLECGPHDPYHKGASHHLIREGQKPSQLHNNCSGKHAGMLTACLALGYPTAGYSNYDHPVQERVREMFSLFLGQPMAQQGWGIDGCGVPTYSVPLAALAQAFVRVADPAGMDGKVDAAVRALNRAIALDSKYIGGTESFCSQVVAETEGRVFAKVGAEGVYGAWIPAAGIGVALKSEDGGSRAAQAAMAAILRELGHPLRFYSPLLRRWTGEVVGQIFCA